MAETRTFDRATGDREVPSIEGERIRRAIEHKMLGVRSDPVEIGRFRIVGRLGHGGMGIVYRAVDPDLQRDVAVKLMAVAGEVARARTLREARSLAQLASPNVVTVHEVGEVNGRVFVAMELVDGMTLDQWCQAHHEPTRARNAQLVDLFEQAARGLIAAHDTGIVHRDVKPTNILIGDPTGEPRLRIADFGLATAPGDRSDDGSGSDLDVTFDPSRPLTISGRVLGTPAYMAPEQLHGVADARSDQFGLCATFFAALFGTPPFASQSLDELAGRFAARRFTDHDARACPRELYRVLERGLAIRPEHRYQDMRALLTDLRRRRRRRSMVRVGSGLTLSLVALTATTGALSYLGIIELGPGAPPPSPSCAGAEALDASWSPERRQAIRDAFARTGASYWEATWKTVGARMTEFATAWRVAKIDVCEARDVRRDQPDALLAARDACLDGAASAFDLLVTALARADRDAIEVAAKLTLALPPVARCNDRAALAFGDDVTVPAETDSEAVRIAATSNHADILARLGRSEEAERVLSDAEHRAEALDRPALRALIAEQRARASYQQANFKEALERGKQSLAFAEAARRPGMMALAWRRMAAANMRLGNVEAATFQISRAEGLVDPADTIQRARNAVTRAQILAAEARSAEVVEAFQRAVALYEEAGFDDVEIAAIRSDLASAMALTGDEEGAREEARRALAAHERHLGASHPRVAQTLLVVAGLAARTGDFLGALESIDRAIAIHEETPTEVPDYAVMAYIRRGSWLVKLRRFDEALATFARARRTAEQSSDAHDPIFDMIDIEIANVDLDAGRSEAARERLAAVVARADENPRTHPLNRAIPRINLAVAEARLGFFAEAMAHAEQGVAEVEGVSTDVSPHLFGALRYAGEVYALAGRPSRARALFMRADAMGEQLGADPEERAAVAFGLAKLTGDRARADELARRASRYYREAFRTDEAAVVDAWRTSETGGAHGAR